MTSSAAVHNTRGPWGISGGKQSEMGSFGPCDGLFWHKLSQETREDSDILFILLDQAYGVSSLTGYKNATVALE